MHQGRGCNGSSVILLVIFLVFLTLSRAEDLPHSRSSDVEFEDYDYEEDEGELPFFQRQTTAGPFYPSTNYGTTNDPFTPVSPEPNIKLQYAKIKILDSLRLRARLKGNTKIDPKVSQLASIYSKNHDSTIFVGWSMISEIDELGNVVQTVDNDRIDFKFSSRDGASGFTTTGPLKDDDGNVLALTECSWQRSTFSGLYEGLDQSIYLYPNSVIYQLVVRDWAWKSVNNSLNITWSLSDAATSQSSKKIFNTSDQYSDTDAIRVDRVFNDGVMLRQSLWRNAKADKAIRSSGFVLQNRNHTGNSISGGTIGYSIQPYFASSLQMNMAFNIYYIPSADTITSLTTWQIALIVIACIVVFFALLVIAICVWVYCF